MGDPGTGIPVAYGQVLSFLNDAGEFCFELSAGIGVIDGSGLIGSGHSTFPQCRQRYVVKLSRPDGSSEDGTILDKIEPGHNPLDTTPHGPDSTLLVAKAYDQNNQIVPNTGIQLKTDVVANSGGHNHDDQDRHTKYAGTIAPVGSANGTVTDNGKTLTGNTGTAGLFFRFNSPAFPNNPAGDHTIAATCIGGRVCTQQGLKQVWVGIKDLIELPATISLAQWNLIGQTISHQKNHFLTADAILKLIALANYYQVTFPNDPVLQLNDASLERGGLFDLFPSKPSWSIPHAEHRLGWVIDIQANGTASAIPAQNYDAFRKLIGDLDMGWYPDDLNCCGHFHVRLLGEDKAQ